MRSIQSRILPNNWLERVVTFDIEKSSLINTHKIMAKYLIGSIKEEKEKSLTNPLSKYLIEYIIFDSEFLTSHYDNLPLQLIEDGFREIKGEKGLNLTRKLHSLFAEFITYQDLKKQGYTILDSKRDNGSCDLVMMKDNKIYNFEVKYKESKDTNISRLYDYIDGYSLLQENEFLRNKTFEINLKVNDLSYKNLKFILKEIDDFIEKEQDVFDGKYIQIFEINSRSKLNRDMNSSTQYLDNFHIKTEDNVEHLIYQLFIQNNGHITKMINKSKRFKSKDNFTGCLIWTLPFHLDIDSAEIESAFNKVLNLNFDLYIYTGGFNKEEYNFIVRRKKVNNTKVKSINISNFKGIKKLDLDFTYQNSDRLLDNIVIYGINGSGKSTILEAIYICLIVGSVYHKESEDLKRIEDFLINYISLGNEWIYNNEEELKIAIELVNDEKLLSATLSYHKKNGLNWNTENASDFSSSLKDSFSYLSSYRLLNPSTVQSAGDWEEIERIEEDVFRRKSRINRDLRYGRSNHFPSLSLQFDNNYRTVKQYLINLITDKKVEALTFKNAEILDKIKESFEIFFPNKKFLEQLSRTDTTKDYRLMIENEDKSIVDLDQLSSGEREVIAFFTFLCTKAIDNSIIIIDEPELHLHSKWQSIILYAIHKIFPNVQLFVASHSNEIHQASSESELFELEKEEKLS